MQLISQLILLIPFISDNTGLIIAQVISVIIFLAIVYFVWKLTQRFVHRLVENRCTKWKLDRWMRAFQYATVYRSVGLAVSAIVAVMLYPIFVPESYEMLNHIMSKIIGIYGIFAFLSVMISFINVLDYFYGRNPSLPLRGVFQAIKIILYLFAALIAISLLLGKRPMYVITGLSALAAVFSLIFKDPILGFAAGIQLSSNKLIKIGDWIEMPSHGADGDVTDITLTTVRVQNFDKTIISIPAYDLISKPFKNWSGMYEAQGRRIKRAIDVDVATVRFLDAELFKKLNRIELLKDYLKTKTTEIATHNEKQNIQESVLNGRHLTNLGTFRAYATNYLRNVGTIRTDMICMIRQLEPGETGIPLEIYCFANTTDWLKYEDIQSDIFDHLYAIMPEFDLYPFQNPTGRNFSQLYLGEGKTPAESGAEATVQPNDENTPPPSAAESSPA